MGGGGFLPAVPLQLRFPTSNLERGHLLPDEGRSVENKANGQLVSTDHSGNKTGLQSRGQQLCSLPTSICLCLSPSPGAAEPPCPPPSPHHIAMQGLPPNTAPDLQGVLPAGPREHPFLEVFL